LVQVVPWCSWLTCFYCSFASSSCSPVASFCCEPFLQRAVMFLGRLPRGWIEHRLRPWRCSILLESGLISREYKSLFKSGLVDEVHCPRLRMHMFSRCDSTTRIPMQDWPTTEAIFREEHTVHTHFVHIVCLTD
jgi:hypothetical protein